MQRNLIGRKSERIIRTLWSKIIKISQYVVSLCYYYLLILLYIANCHHLSASKLLFITLNTIRTSRKIINLNKNPSSWKHIRKYFKQIESEGKVCHQECVERSCVGPLDTQCIKCRNYKQGNRCLRSCELGWYSMPSDDGSKECFKCHKECRESCFGPVCFFSCFIDVIFQLIIQFTFF